MTFDLCHRDSLWFLGLEVGLVIYIYIFCNSVYQYNLHPGGFVFRSEHSLLYYRRERVQVRSHTEYRVRRRAITTFLKVWRAKQANDSFEST